METLHNIYIGASQKMHQLQSESVDLVVTSPPYPMIEMWGEIFVKPYVPRVKSSNRVVSNKRNKKLKLFNRVIPGEFSFHYDTDQLERNMHMFRPNDDISISVKLHGTSAIIGNVRTLKPKWNGLYAKIFPFLPKFLQRTTTEYDYICSSRSVIINGKYMNSDKVSFGSDVQREIYEYMKLLKSVGALDNGETIYGEIVGYYTGTYTPIQKMGKPYDYGCNVGESKLMIYRVNLDTDILPRLKTVGFLS